jgi:hypothetical protein
MAAGWDAFVWHQSSHCMWRVRAGKGVIVAATLEEAYQAVDDMMVNNTFGSAGGWWS